MTATGAGCVGLNSCLMLPVKSVYNFAEMGKGLSISAMMATISMEMDAPETAKYSPATHVQEGHLSQETYAIWQT